MSNDVFSGKNCTDLSILYVMRNDSFQCHRRFGRVFRGQKRVFREKLALDTSGAESAGVLQLYSRPWPDGENKTDSARKCTTSTPI